jgi:hypothetical protein
MKQAFLPMSGTETGSSTVILRQLATRFRTMSERESDPRLRVKLSEMASDYERQAKLQEA